MTSPLGAGIIGAGGIFVDHANAYKKLGNRVRLVGLADVDESRLSRTGQEYFIPYTTTDYHELLARTDIDIVSICTPPFLHEEMVIAALDAGKFVICEKPLAHTLAATDRIIEHAKKYPGKLSTVFQFRYNDNAARAIFARDDGLLGELTGGSFVRKGRISESQKSGWWGKWQVAGGGAAMTQAIHELDLAVFFLGPVIRVTASMNTFLHSIESEDTFSASLEHESGAISSCYCVLATGATPSLEWSILGTNAGIHQTGLIDRHGMKQRVHLARQLNKKHPLQKQKTILPGIAGKVLNKVLNRIKPKKQGGGKSMHVSYMRSIVDAIEASVPLPIGPSESRRAVELCTAIYTSAITKEPVDLPLDSSAKFYDGLSIDVYDGRGNSNNE